MLGTGLHDTVSGLAVHKPPVLACPYEHRVGSPDLAHLQHPHGRREVVAVDELLDTLAADAKQFADLGGADQVMHVTDHSQDATGHLTRGQDLLDTSHMTSPAKPDHTYGVAVTRQARVTSRVLHIAEIVQGRRWMETRFGRALCAVPVAMFPEPGTPEDATCRACIRKYRKVAMARSSARNAVTADD